jgi:hypothetical protein
MNTTSSLLPTPPTPAELGEFLTWLTGRGWIKSRDIAAVVPEWNARKVRELAEMSEGQIVSGQQGYKLTLECTPEEWRAFDDHMASRCRHITNRRVHAAKVWHAAPRPRATDTATQ